MLSTPPESRQELWFQDLPKPLKRSGAFPPRPSHLPCTLGTLDTLGADASLQDADVTFVASGANSSNGLQPSTFLPLVD